MTEKDRPKRLKKRVDYSSEIYRPLPWNLMVARAMRAPSPGKGAIHGIATDLDALEKALLPNK